MEHYDVIIVGAGIAGCGLAYNLKREGYKGSVLVIDKKEIGSNYCYGVRGVYEETIKKHKLQYVHKYKRLEVGAYDQVYFTIDNNVYLIDYKKSCLRKIKKSSAEFRLEKAIAIDAERKILVTNISKYNFKYLIDCSGSGFFIKKQFVMPLPFMYWMGDLKVIKKNFSLKDIDLSGNSFYIFFSDTGFVEDFYPLKNTVLEGEWSYSKNCNFSDIKSHDKTILKKIQNSEIIKRDYSFVPVSPILPLVYKDYAFLGDSFGNANPAVGMGIDMILESSIILTKAIKKDNLDLFEKEWKKKYLENFIRCLSSKLDRYNNKGTIKKIKNYPRLSEVINKMGNFSYFFDSLLKNKIDIIMPKELKRIYPKRSILFQSYHYALLKTKYLNWNLIWK